MLCYYFGNEILQNYIERFVIAEVMIRHVFCRKPAKNGVKIDLLMRQIVFILLRYLIAALITEGWSAYERIEQNTEKNL